MPDRQNAKPKIVCIVGCTASGKSAISHALARDLDAEILSIDSMKVYRRMDIGTAKPTPQQQAEVKYHLIDVVEPSEAFSAARFAELADQTVEDLTSRGKTIIAEGGTVLYLKAMTEGLFEAPQSDPAIRQRLQEQANTHGGEFLHGKLAEIDPDAAQRIHYNDIKRIVRALEVYELTGKPISTLQQQFGRLRSDYEMLFVGINHDRERLNRRINARVKQMIEQGLADEAHSIYHDPAGISQQARQAVGYAELFNHFEDKYDLQTAVEKIKINTRRLGKSQRTWFRRMPHINWYNVNADQQPIDLLNEIKQKVTDFLAGP